MALPWTRAWEIFLLAEVVAGKFFIWSCWKSCCRKVGKLKLSLSGNEAKAKAPGGPLPLPDGCAGFPLGFPAATPEIPCKPDLTLGSRVI